MKIYFKRDKVEKTLKFSLIKNEREVHGGGGGVRERLSPIVLTLKTPNIFQFY